MVVISVVFNFWQFVMVRIGVVVGEVGVIFVLYVFIVDCILEK